MAGVARRVPSGPRITRDLGGEHEDARRRPFWNSFGGGGGRFSLIAVLAVPISRSSDIANKQIDYSGEVIFFRMIYLIRHLALFSPFH